MAEMTPKEAQMKVVDEFCAILFRPTELDLWLESLTPILDRWREEETLEQRVQRDRDIETRVTEVGDGQ